MPYLKTAKDYVLYRLSSQAVEMDDGTTLEAKVTSLNSLISQKLNSENVVNNLTTTKAGYALDARQGKALNDKYTTLNSALEWKAAGDVTGTSVITLNNWNELSVLIIGSDSNYYSLHIIKSMMISTGRRFRTGYYFSDNKYAGLELSIGSTGVRIAELFENGVSKTSSARLLAWYR